MTLSPSRQAALDEALATARQHIPIQMEVMARPCGFAIVDEGARFAVYCLDHYRHGQPAGGFLPPGRPLSERGPLAGTVALDGTFAPAS